MRIIIIIMLIIQDKWKSKLPWLQIEHKELKTANITTEGIWEVASFRMRVVGTKDSPQERSKNFVERRLRIQRLKGLWQES